MKRFYHDIPILELTNEENQRLSNDAKFSYGDAIYTIVSFQMLPDWLQKRLKDEDDSWAVGRVIAVEG